MPTDDVDRAKDLLLKMYLEIKGCGICLSRNKIFPYYKINCFNLINNNLTDVYITNRTATEIKNSFGKSLENELLSRIEKDVRDVCSLL